MEKILSHLYLSRDGIRQWSRRHADTTRTKWALLVLAFSESSFFLVPVDVMLIAILVVVPARWVYYSTLATLGSVVGGVFGYLIGYFFFETAGQWIINTYNLAEELEAVGRLFADNAFWAIFISAFTPIPYKVFTISAGFFRLDLIIFIIASTIGRGLRFFILGYLLKHFGAATGRYLYKYFNLVTLLAGLSILLVGLYFFLR
ncbi:MAG: VTT domain-containing protein [Candidatus Paceibacterota bacterium]